VPEGDILRQALKVEDLKSRKLAAVAGPSANQVRLCLWERIMFCEWRMLGAERDTPSSRALLLCSA
jgi:hypothetical protein